MQQLCWDCRQHPEGVTQPEARSEDSKDEAAISGLLPLEQLDLQSYDTSIYN